MMTELKISGELCL